MSAPVAGDLVTFDEPLVVGRGSLDALDLVATRRRQRTAFFLARISVATVIGGLAGVVDGSGATTLVVALALGYVPLAVLDAGHVDAGRWLLVRVLAIAADIGLLLGAQASGVGGEVLAMGGIGFVAMHTWRGGRRDGAAATALLLVAEVATSVVGDDPTTVTTVVTTALAAALVVFVVDDQTATGDLATSGLRLVHDKAEAVLAGIADAVVTTTAAGDVCSVNRAAEGVLGVVASQARTMRCADLVDLRDGATALRCAGTCDLLDRSQGRSVELHRTGPAGQRQPLLASATPLLDGDGEIVEIVHSFRDITSVKQADEAKTLFLATASHELKTPLTVIRGFAQMLRTSELSPERHHDATTAIESRAVQLSSIVDRLLMTSRIEAGKVQLTPIATRVEEILVQRVRELEAATSRTVRRSVPEDLPIVWADPDALATILDHLLENAVKYSPAGGAISLEAEAETDGVVIRCRDEGIGMNEAQRERCFDRFWQAEGTDVRRFGGTGIGLYVVKSLVEAMHGEIAVDSAPGEGSTFTVILARRAPETHADDLHDRPAVDEDRDGSMINEFMRQVGMPVDAGGTRP